MTAPHRLGFFAGAVALAATALWWWGAMLSRSMGAAVPWTLSPLLAHGLLTAGAALPMFVLGFLFTAGPRWLGLPEVPAAALRRPVLLHVVGWVLVLVGVHVAHPPLPAVGVALATLAWAELLHRWVRLLRASPVADRLHARCLAVAGFVGLAALALGTLGLTLGEAGWVRAAVQALLWGWMAPTFAAVSHRMIPFFTAAALPALEAWRPNALLLPMLGGPALAGALRVASALGAPMPTAVSFGAAAVLALSGLALLALALRWGLLRSFANRLLAMLHGGFVWLGVALLLEAWALAAPGFDLPGPGLAPLHALSLGWLGTTLLAMITRVAAGHSGRPLAADGLAWALYWIAQAAAVLRVAAELGPGAWLLLPAAASAWLLACAGWALRHGRWLGRPRIDGRPG